MAAVLSEWDWDPMDLPANLLPQNPHVDSALHKLAVSIKALKTDLRHSQAETTAHDFQSRAALEQLSQEATLDSEFESVLIKQMKTLSLSAILFWCCFSLAVLGCVGLLIFCLHHWCTVRKYPSLVEALESMQQLLPPEENRDTPIPANRAYRLGTAH